MTVSVDKLNFSYDNGKSTVLEDISFEAQQGRVTTIIGPNGAGKTTTLKCIAGLYKHGGEIRFEGKVMSYQDLVEQLSFMEQSTDCSINLDVFTMIMLGMIQELGFKVTSEDIQAVNEVLELVGIKHLANCKIGEISGGQRQLVFLAQALVKKPKILLLDEPTGALDLFHQIQLMKLVREVTRKRNCVTIMTLHHLDMAMKYADNVITVYNKRVYSNGRPEEVFNETMLHEVYHVNVEILTDSKGERFMHLLDSEENSPEGMEVIAFR